TRTAEGRLAAVWQVDLAVALALAAIGGVVVMDSLQVGIGWGVEGPEAGFFPFFVGLLLLAGASFTAARNLLAARRDLDVFVEAAGFRRVLAVLVPTIVYVAAIGWLGIYLASALLIAAFMRVFGRYGYLLCGGLGVAIAVALFLMFEIWFQVPLPKGPLEAALGL
ncbi:MAG TPA: tripartite tricarboxylate transporter TctB family protein, partial [Gaiellales bacterium]|nr:tripartite tricarboxylate transporter TctB family protein [Gaiellales bacterium]